jgi:hypothetical protein
MHAAYIVMNILNADDNNNNAIRGIYPGQSFGRKQCFTSSFSKNLVHHSAIVSLQFLDRRLTFMSRERSNAPKMPHIRLLKLVLKLRTKLTIELFPVLLIIIQHHDSTHHILSNGSCIIMKVSDFLCQKEKCCNCLDFFSISQKDL